VQSVNRPGQIVDSAHMEFHLMKTDVVHAFRFTSDYETQGASNALCLRKCGKIQALRAASDTAPSPHLGL